jgi:predicted phosphohydrolase
MNRVAWTTDIHLEFLGDSAAIGRFCQSIADTDPDIVLIGGDIAVAPSIGKSLLLLENYLQRPICFVLGNHDFYNGSISHVRSVVTRLTRQSPWLRWLSISGIIELTPNTGLLGHDGWADGRLGNSARSRVVLNDYLLIRELKGLPKSERFAKLNSLGDKSARYFNWTLDKESTTKRRLLG